MGYVKGKYIEFRHVNSGAVNICLCISRYGGILIYSSSKDYHTDLGYLYHFSKEDWNVINVFSTIHEVSDRIKEIEAEKEKENWPVKVGLFGEFKEPGYHLFYKIIGDIQKDDTSNIFIACIEILNVLEDTEDIRFKKGQIIPKADIHPDSKDTILTQEQYEARIKELEGERFENGDYLLHEAIHTFKDITNSYVELIIFDSYGKSTDTFNGVPLLRLKNGKPRSLDLMHTGGYISEQFKKITEQEALEILTGKKWVEKDEYRRLKEEIQRLQLKKLVSGKSNAVEKAKQRKENHIHIPLKGVNGHITWTGDNLPSPEVLQALEDMALKAYDQFKMTPEQFKQRNKKS